MKATVKLLCSALVLLSVLPLSQASALKVGVTDLPSSINPIESMDVESSFILAQIFENLYEYDENDQLVSSLVKGHQISPDGKVYRFFLKDNLKFHDGSPLDSHAVVNSLTKSLEALRGNAGWALQNIVGYNEFLENLKTKKSAKLKGFEVLDSKTFQIQLNVPFRLLLHTLTARNFAIFKLSKKGTFIGNGSYRLSKISKGEILLSKVAIAPAKAPEQIQFLKSDGSFATAEKNNFDVFIPPSDLESLPDGFQRRTFNSMQAIILIFNTHTKAFGQSKVRCAIVNKLRKFFSKKYPRQMPALATLNFGTNGLVLPPETSDEALPRSFTVDYVNSSAFFPDKFLNALKSDLATQKVDGKFRNNSVVTFLEAIEKKKIDIAMLGWAPDYIDIDAYLTPLLRSNEQYNLFKYNSETMDTLLDLGRELKDPWDRSRVYQTVINKLSKSCVIGFLGGLRGEIVLSRRVVSPKISGLGIHGIRFRDWSLK